MRGEEPGYVIVVKSEAGSAQALGVGREIELAAEDPASSCTARYPRLPKRCKIGRKSARKKMSTAASAGNCCSNPR